MNACTVQWADILVIGAGFIGLSVACALLDRDPALRVRVVDAGDFAAGGSGRNGAGIRLQWARDFNVQLCKDSLETFENVEERFQYPGGIDFQPNGYLILARSEAAMQNLKNAVSVQHALGVPSEIVVPDECMKLQPGLNIEGLHGGTYCQRDGTASPFKWLDALLKTCRRRGAEVSFGHTVCGLTTSGSSFVAQTDKGRIAAQKIVLCTDWAVPELLSPLGVDLPICRQAKEALVTEACDPIVMTALMDSGRGLGLKQVARGNIVLTLTRQTPATSADDTPDYLQMSALAAIDLLPMLEDVRVLRKWTGSISATPDMQPVIGETEIPGLFVAVSAYKGFMMSPAIGEVVADLVVNDHSDHIAAVALSPARFSTSQLVPETLTI